MSPRNTLDILKQTAVGNEKDIIDCMVEVELNESKADDVFLAIMETLTRVGVYVPARNFDLWKPESQPPKTLYQTCHILYKSGKYFIVHFKHLFILDGRSNGFTREDVMRMNTIIKLLEEWDLVKVKVPEQMTDFAMPQHIKVIKHNDAKNWILKPKYNMHYNRERTRRT